MYRKFSIFEVREIPATDIRPVRVWIEGEKWSRSLSLKEGFTFIEQAITMLGEQGFRVIGWEEISQSVYKVVALRHDT